MRRDRLKDLKYNDTVHAGLWLDKYLSGDVSASQEAGGARKQQLVREVARIREPRDYPVFFRRYREALESLGATVKEAEALGRLAVGLGGQGVMENHLSLHRTYGVPYIPGTALKGLMSRFAATRLDGEPWARRVDPRNFHRGEAQRVLFGTPDEAGLLNVYDALPVPGTWNLTPDVMTPHHFDYYAGKHNAPPADWDSPVPIPFLTATGTYLLALRMPAGGELWLDAAWELLLMALSEEGVGAKTHLGYGRMRLKQAAVQTK